MVGKRTEFTEAMQYFLLFYKIRLDCPAERMLFLKNVYMELKEGATSFTLALFFCSIFKKNSVSDFWIEPEQNNLSHILRQTQSSWPLPCRQTLGISTSSALDRSGPQRSRPVHCPHCLPQRRHANALLCHWPPQDMQARRSRPGCRCSGMLMIKVWGKGCGTVAVSTFFRPYFG